MTKYSDFQQGALFTHLSTDYAAVCQFSRHETLTYQNLQSGTEKSQTLGELFAAAGMAELDFTPLKRTIAMVDHFMKTGFLPRGEWERVTRQLDQQIAPLSEVLQCYQNAGVADETGRGAPLILFIPYYARRLLQTCDMIEQKYSGEGKAEFLWFVSTQWLRQNDMSHAPA